MTRNKPHVANGFAISPPSLAGRLRITIVGDSITHCGEGDYTWRYRLWQWFKVQGITASFVGPYLGTYPSQPAKPPQPAPVPGDPVPEDPGPQTSGGYALDCDPDFQSHHFANSGRQVAQAQGLIADVVREYKSNMLLVFLGVNDMIWFASDAEGTIKSMKAFIDNTRAVEPNMVFAIGNVPLLKSFEKGRPDLNEQIPKYNQLLKEALQEWTTAASPIQYVDVASSYICDLKDPNSGEMDGLHPSARGDFQIAHAFTATLHNAYGLGNGPLAIPSKIPARDVSIPSNIRAEGSPMGVTVTWTPIYGGRYEIRDRQIPSDGGNNPEWRDRHVTLVPRYDTTATPAGVHYEYQLRTWYGHEYGEWSPIVSAISRHDTAPPPKVIKLVSTEDGFDIEWEQPAGEWHISQNEIIWVDDDAPGTFPGAVGARGTSAKVTGLTKGHRYGTLMTTWTDPEGGSFWGGGPPVLCGGGTPTKPEELILVRTSHQEVELHWTAADNAAGYVIYKRNVDAIGDVFSSDGNIIRENSMRISLVDPTAIEFCVAAVNGTIESTRTNAVRANDL